MYIKKVEEELYQLNKEGQVIGTFKILQYSQGIGKLEQLHVKDDLSPGRILEIFEVIQVYVEQENFRELHVESHSDTLDFLLRHQQFDLKDVEKKLWVYKVAHK
ncbi:hypothetical protein [Halobacillus litoralis]|uniref:hypothetical protein n=1 Tax=Halobacillus litoralis TaxID=45668 RepID=UPI001CFC5420|nr:hypothetical protein [Halobacillus litoralis]